MERGVIYEFFDLLGQIVIHVPQIDNDDQEVINLTELRSGSYFVYLLSEDGGAFTKKIIVDRK